MVLAVVLAALLLCFVFFKRHIGIAFLAMVAGLAVYDHFGALFAETIRTWVPAVDVTLTQQILYALFVAEGMTDRQVADLKAHYDAVIAWLGLLEASGEVEQAGSMLNSKTEMIRTA